MSDREELIALKIAHHTFVAEDGYLSTAVHDNKGAADIVLEWLQEHDRKVKAEAWDAGFAAHDQGYLSDANPYRQDDPRYGGQFDGERP